jgi:[protein-PII] uridylyltransferase
LPDSYWLAEPPAWQLSNALQVAEAEAHFGEAQPSVVAADEPDAGATRVSVFAPDRPGIFFRICAGLASAGASIVDARIHTTRDGMALDNLLVQDSQRRAYSDRRIRARLTKAVERALSADVLPSTPEPQPLPRRRAAFKIAPSVVVADHASTRTTVVEVNGRDREGLLARLALAIHREGLQVRSAHIATYGERAVDVFYLTGSDGKKLSGDAIHRLREALLAAVSETEARSRAA